MATFSFQRRYPRNFHILYWKVTTKLLLEAYITNYAQIQFFTHCLAQEEKLKRLPRALFFPDQK
jgi:hypothetical protein